ncbi:MAG: glycerol acyltransferase [Sphingobacteriales bacterium]|nr:MAG: glycerol acyltransferase [Sphingobacteriales bacterium]TAF78553.1 MAG: glycerol acyltransferase [Sphingobacteriales bacterium]
MIIQAKALPFYVFKYGIRFLTWVFGRMFNKLVIKKAKVYKNHSYLLMCNHFSFWDGFWACYLCLNGIHEGTNMKGFYVMILEKQLQKNMFLRYLGCFSVAPGRASVSESLAYAAQILNTPGNVLLMYPQGNLESQYVRHIVVKEGIIEIIKRIKGDCQLLWSSNFIEYFESFKPSVYFNVLDCGAAKNFEMNTFTTAINKHHTAAMQHRFRFTKEVFTTT